LNLGPIYTHKVKIISWELLMILKDALSLQKNYIANDL